MRKIFKKSNKVEKRSSKKNGLDLSAKGAHGKLSRRERQLKAQLKAAMG